MGRLTPILITVVLAMAPTLASAGQRVCVRFDSADVDSPESFRRFALDEIRRHDGFAALEGQTGCQISLRLEYLVLGSRGVLTGRLIGQVPTRADVDGLDALPDAISEMIARLLDSTPQSMEANLGRFLDRAYRRSARLARGSYLFGVEGYQLVVRAPGGASYLPGLAVRLRRERGRWAVGVRGGVALRLGSDVGTGPPRIGLVGSVQPEVAWFFDPEGTASTYVSGSIGAQVIRAIGRDPAGAFEAVPVFGAATHLRAGVELLRHTDHRIDLFAAAEIPFFVTESVETDLISYWTPSVVMGMGVAF